VIGPDRLRHAAPDFKIVRISTPIVFHSFSISPRPLLLPELSFML
jgi:hypothetical protein